MKTTPPAWPGSHTNRHSDFSILAEQTLSGHGQEWEFRHPPCLTPLTEIWDKTIHPYIKERAVNLCSAPGTLTDTDPVGITHPAWRRACHESCGMVSGPSRNPKGSAHFRTQIILLQLPAQGTSLGSAFLLCPQVQEKILQAEKKWKWANGR